MLNVAICDDNPLTASYVEEYLSNVPIRDIAYEVFCSGTDLINYLHKNPSEPHFSIYFMDIEMPGINGIETASRIRELDAYALIIFITEHKEYVYQVFNVLPFRFIIKPLEKDALDTVLHEAINNIRIMKQLFFFKQERISFQIPFQEIKYFEGAGRKVRLLSTKTEYLFYGKISDIKEKVDKNIFVQIHKSYLVNMEFIRSISETEVLLEDNIRLPISKKFRKEVKSGHLNFMEWRCGE